MSETNKTIFATSLVDIDGLGIFWNKVKGIIEDNEQVTAAALTDLDSRVTNAVAEAGKNIISEGSIKYCTIDGQENVKCLELVLASGDIVHIPVGELVDVYTAGDHITIDDDNKVSVNVAGLPFDAAGSAANALSSAKLYTDELGRIVKGVYEAGQLTSEGHEQRITALENVSIATEDQILAIFA